MSGHEGCVCFLAIMTSIAPNILIQAFVWTYAFIDSLEKTLMLGGIGGRRRRGMTEDKMVGWHYRLNGHRFG